MATNYSKIFANEHYHATKRGLLQNKKTKAEFAKAIKKKTETNLWSIDRGRIDKVILKAKEEAKEGIQHYKKFSKKYGMKMKTVEILNPEHYLITAAATASTGSKIGGKEGKELAEIAKEMYDHLDMSDEGRLKAWAPRKKIPRDKISRLLRKLFLFATAGTSLLFLSPNITGNTIANLSMNLSDAIGLILLIFSGILGFLLMKKN